MGRIEASASLKDDLSPKLDQMASNVDAKVDQMKGDFADLERSTTASFGEMVGAFGTGQLAADLFRESVQAVGRFVRESADAYVEHNRQLREAGEAYDTIIDKQDQWNRTVAEGKSDFGAYVSHWGDFVSYLSQGMPLVAALSLAFSNAATGISIGQQSGGGASGAGSTFAEEQSYRERQARDAERKAREEEVAARRAAAEALREETQRIRESNRAMEIGIKASLRGFSRRNRFEEDAVDPSDPTGSNKSAFSAPGDGSRDSEFGAFSPISSQYMKELEAAQKRTTDKAKEWGNLWSGTINATMDAVLFDTHNFGRDFANIIKKALEKALIGDISASAGGPIGKLLGGILGIKDARTSFETQVAPELARASARGKL